ncbi:hypothetical protein CR513_12358, partial [Mucuna pruriens]
MTMIIKLIYPKTFGECRGSKFETNSLQEGEDDTYMEGETPTLEGPIIRGRLKWIQEEVQQNLATLKDQGEDQGGHNFTMYPTALKATYMDGNT